jgi:diguanylate cyclase (GGDEF)-like protein/PAS domain S-box-containing protein
MRETLDRKVDQVVYLLCFIILLNYLMVFSEPKHYIVYFLLALVVVNLFLYRAYMANVGSVGHNLFFIYQMLVLYVLIFLSDDIYLMVLPILHVFRFSSHTNMRYTGIMLGSYIVGYVLMTLAHDTFVGAGMWFATEFFRWMPLNICGLVVAAYLSSSVIDINRQYQELTVVHEQFYKNTDCAVRYLDNEGIIRVVNKEAEQFYRLPYRDLYGKAERDLLGGGSKVNEEGQYYSPVEETLDTGNEFTKVEREETLESGELRTFEMSTYLARNDRRDVVGVMGVFRDITSQKLLRESLENTRRMMDQISMTDAVTGLYNFRYFRDVMAQKNADKDQEWTLLMIHVDNLEDFFLTFGRQAGEKILKEMGLLLRKSVGEDNLAVKYGDTDFAVLLPEGGLEPAQKLAEELREQAEKQSFGDLREVSPGDFTLSVGVMACPKEDLTSGEDWMTLAEKALYQAKAAGPNHVESLGDQPPQQ